MFFGRTRVFLDEHDVKCMTVTYPPAMGKYAHIIRLNQNMNNNTTESDLINFNQLCYMFWIASGHLTVVIRKFLNKFECTALLPWSSLSRLIDYIWVEVWLIRTVYISTSWHLCYQFWFELLPGVDQGFLSMYGSVCLIPQTNKVWSHRHFKRGCLAIQNDLNGADDFQNARFSILIWATSSS